MTRAKKKWEIKEEVMDLRRSGLSYGEIRAKIPLAKSTVSRWCKDITLTKQQIARLEASLLLKDRFWIAGLMLYWAEGHKSKKVGVSNSDPNIIEFMMEWLRRYCNADNSRFKPFLNLHSGQNENEIKEFWSRIIKLPKEQFGKSYIKKEGTGHRKNILYQGTLRIDVCNSNLLYKILGWIDGVIELFHKDKDFIESNAPIAQLVEHLPLKQAVPGSNPGGGTGGSSSVGRA